MTRTLPKLRNDCFALPSGVDWTPVDEALERLRSSVVPVVGTETQPLSGSVGRVLSADVFAPRANPPGANSAVDGYGFRFDESTNGATELPLVAGRAAAGAPFSEAVPKGHAIRILTGALLPEGIDTVVLEEDCSVEDQKVFFKGMIKQGSNTRQSGEDVEAGQKILEASRCLRPPDIALLAATGIVELDVFRKLKVGVLSTGDELVEPGSDEDQSMTYDANRPMLLSLLSRWGHKAVDLGHVADDRDGIQSSLDAAASSCDAILTSGGASAGDEDHISALLQDVGSLHAWRIALKPGRPLALAVWNGVPVFGLPGNPVAALVCTLIFARPSLAVLSGGAWVEPQGFFQPAGFTKTKKPGRREYLRARMRDGRVEIFSSEGSGRISGLSWAEGLVELPDGALSIAEGDPVRYIPYSSFGL